MFTALLIVARSVHIATSVLVAGSLTFEVVALGSARRQISDDLHQLEAILLQLAFWTLLIALVSAAFWFWLEVVSMTGSSFVESFSPSTWNTVLFQTTFGHVWQVRLGLITTALVLVVSALSGKNGPGRSAILALWLLSVVLLVSLAWISHAAAAGVQPIGLTSDALHLCAAGAWIGGLVPLAICLTLARVSSAIATSVPLIVGRFSTLSLCSVSALVASGVCNSWLLVGSIPAFFTTDYGRLLLLKLGLFGTLIGFAVRNRVLIKAAASTNQTHFGFLQQLRRGVISEICMGAAVVVIVACLGVTPPARHQ